MTGNPATEDELIIAAQQGDDDAYRQLMTAYRAELHAQCYRMLGSAADAEDALQDTLVRAWRGLAGFEGRSSLRGWLCAIATNSCRKIIKRRPTRVLPMDYGPPADPHDVAKPPLTDADPAWIEPYPDQLEIDADVNPTPEGRYAQRESVELAFIAAVQLLTPGQRAVLILHDVLSFSAAEIAGMLTTTPTAVYSSLQRAHKALNGRLPERSQQATLRHLGDSGIRDLVERYLSAWHRCDIDALVAMLTQDAVLSMPPLLGWHRGPAAIRDFLAGSIMAEPGRSRLVPTHANGQLAFGHYRLHDATGQFLPHSLDVLTMRATQIAEITAFTLPGSFGQFGLSPALDYLPAGDTR